jgi:hypothetical protein
LDWVRRTFFTAVVQQAMTLKVRDDSELYRLLLRAELPELRILLAGTAAGPFLAEDNGKMFRSIHSVVSSAVTCTSLMGTIRLNGDEHFLVD